MYRRPVIRCQHMASIMYSPNYDPKISVGRQNHFGLSHQSLKSVGPDRFWQKNLSKVVPQTTFATKISQAELILAGNSVPNLVPL